MYCSVIEAKQTLRQPEVAILAIRQSGDPVARNGDLFGVFWIATGDPVARDGDPDGKTEILDLRPRPHR